MFKNGNFWHKMVDLRYFYKGLGIFGHVLMLFNRLARGFWPIRQDPKYFLNLQKYCRITFLDWFGFACLRTDLPVRQKLAAQWCPQEAFGRPR